MNKNQAKEPEPLAKKKNQLAEDIMKFLNQQLKAKLKSPKQIALENYAQYLAYTQKNKRIKRFSQRLLNKMSSLDIAYSEFSSKICSIEAEDCSSIRNAVLNKDKLSYFFWVPMTSAHKMLVGIYFKTLGKDDCEKFYQRGISNDYSLYAQKTIKYYDITTEDLSSHVIEQNWIQKMASDKYPAIEYDSNGLLQKIELLFKSVPFVDPSCDSLQSCIQIQSQKHLYSLSIKKETHCEQNDPNDFDRSEINAQVLDNTSYSQFREEISDIINKNHWKMILSRQEKFLVESHIPFIISGRPGTGKTTVILFKLFASFFNLQFEKSILKNNNIDWGYIKFNLGQSQLSNQFRFVFTSLSQDLCDKVQEMYSNMLLQENINVGYKPVQRKEFCAIHSFRDVKTYPLFVCFRKIMFMVDGSLTHQFFSRTNLLKFEQATTECQVNRIRDMEYICNNYLSTTIEDEIRHVNYLYRSPELNTQNRTMTKRECGIEEFTKFYCDLLKKANEFKIQSNSKAKDISYKTQVLYRILSSIKKLQLTSGEIYAQIYSVIKGSLFSYLSPLNAITREAYNQKGKKLTDVDDENEFGCNERDIVYDIFLLYEEHKRKYNLFDIQDLVNHLIRQVRIEFKDITIIDYLFLDEIQDLTVNQIYLLVLVSRYPAVFAGDTCQTISESNRFRFKDLKSLFYFFEQIIPNYPHVEGALLNINYRLNASLLNLTTFFANIIKQMFPNTVDKFNDDYSVKITPFLPSELCDISALVNVIKGPDNLQGQNFTFSYYHCFICRTPEEAKTLSSKYNHIIFTSDIQRCKGLEFEIVIVYNFFSTSKFKEVWTSVFNHLDVSPANISLQNLSHALRKEDLTLVIKNMKKFLPLPDNPRDDDIVDTIIKAHKEFLLPKCSLQFNKHTLFEFCAELKQFYVIITRAQTFLLFYEEDPQCSFIAFTTKHELIGSESKQLIQQMTPYFEKMALSIANRQKLAELAEKEFKDTHYSKAAYLFKTINEQNKAIEAEVYDLNEESKQIDPNEKEYFDKHNEEILASINKIQSCFRDPLGIEGQALTHLGRYEKAIASYDKNRLYDKSAYIYLYILKDYLKAFEVYNCIGNFKLCVTALTSGNQFRKLYQYLNESYQTIGVVEYSLTYRQYANQYLRNYLFKPFKLKDINLETFANTTFSMTFSRFENRRSNINEAVSDFLSNYSNRLSKLSMKADDQDLTYLFSFTPSFSYTLGYEKDNDKRKVDELLHDFSFDEDISQMIRIFFKREEPSLIPIIIELIPEAFYLRSDSFKVVYYNTMKLNSKKNGKAHITKFYSRIKQGIEVICDNAKVDRKTTECYIRYITTYAGCYKSMYYTKEENCIISSLLLQEGKIRKMTLSNVTGLTKALYVSSLFRLFILNVLNDKAIDSNSPLLHIRELKSSLYQSNIIAQVDVTLGALFNGVYSSLSLKGLIESFDIFTGKFFSVDWSNSFRDYFDLMIHITSIALFIYSSSQKGKYLDLSKCGNINQLLSLAERLHLFGSKLANYSGEKTPSNILLFNLFSPFGISYFPKITTITPIHLYQQLNMCLINHNAPLFHSSSSIKVDNLYKKLKGMFDAKGTNFILKQKTAYKLYKRCHQGTLKNILKAMMRIGEEDSYVNISYSLSGVLNVMPWFFSLSTLNTGSKSPKEYNTSYLLELFERSIYSPDSGKHLKKMRDEAPSILFHFLLPILLTTKEKSKKYAQGSSTLVFYLGNLTQSLGYNSKSNLDLLLMILKDSYGITNKLIEDKCSFKEEEEISNLSFRKDASIWLKILPLLKEIEYSPMIALIWIKKITYQLISCIQKEIGQDLVVVYDINEVLTTVEMPFYSLHKYELNSNIKLYFEILRYFIENFLSTNANSQNFEEQFYEMNVFCIFLSFLRLMKDKHCKWYGVTTTPIQDFIESYKQRRCYSKLPYVHDENLLLKYHMFPFVTKGGKSKVLLIERKIKDLFTPIHEEADMTDYRVSLTDHSYSFWNQSFQLTRNEDSKFVLDKYNNETTYSKALLSIMKKYPARTQTSPTVLNDKCLFGAANKATFFDDSSKFNYQDYRFEYHHSDFEIQEAYCPSDEEYPKQPEKPTWNSQINFERKPIKIHSNFIYSNDTSDEKSSSAERIEGSSGDDKSQEQKRPIINYQENNYYSDLRSHFRNNQRKSDSEDDNLFYKPYFHFSKQNNFGDNNHDYDNNSSDLDEDYHYDNSGYNSDL